MPPQTPLETDIVIVGGGPSGLSVAQELIGSGLRVLVLESGLSAETPEHAALNAVAAVDGAAEDGFQARRAAYHSALPSAWSGEVQRFGVRCRGLGGSTQAWAGKSASFDAIDFAARPWVPGSGWPVSHEALAPYVDRAAGFLNLGPNVYDARFWDLAGSARPEPEVDPAAFRDFFWQFSRGRINPMDVMRFGAEFAALEADNVRVLLNATVTQVHTDPDGGRFDRLEVATPDGGRATVRARACVLAASAIENARLLLVSRGSHAPGLGNRNDLVGRHLSDHLLAPVGRFDAAAAPGIAGRFGFYGLRHDGHSHMYAHGLALSETRQEAEELVNGAVFFMETRAEDDPVSALARLVRRTSPSPYRDAVTVALGPGHVAKAVGLRALQSDRMPDSARRFIVDTVLRRMPGTAAREFQFRGVPHKLVGAEAQGIVEQAPDRDNRVVLSDQSDPFGLPLPEVRWRVGTRERRTLLRMTQMLRDGLAEACLPVPELPDWAASGEAGAVPVIDMGHTTGTTRMSESPTTGVVTPDCRLHDVHGVYLAGGSVMPTTGHANPTLMMMALAVRLADRLKAEYGS
ncbi:hypothetical protein ATO6_10590 [Oceanicola sp. 22II-s10i]|nr:hypothetical protein ATO6_10590 [Oceanicola sp. 22II-s10i]